MVSKLYECSATAAYLVIAMLIAQYVFLVPPMKRAFNHFLYLLSSLAVSLTVCMLGGQALAQGVYLALLSHSGSRGSGEEVASFYSRRAMALRPALPREMKHLAWLDLDSKSKSGSTVAKPPCQNPSAGADSYGKIFYQYIGRCSLEMTAYPKSEENCESKIKIKIVLFENT